MLTPLLISLYSCTFFLTDTATTEIYTLSLHDALPISNADLEQLDLRNSEERGRAEPAEGDGDLDGARRDRERGARDRKSTRLNSSHRCISYAVFCLKKKKKKKKKYELAIRIQPRCLHL